MLSKKLGIVSIVALSLFACSSNDDVTDRIKQLEENQIAKQTERDEREHAKLEEQLEVAPDWYLAPPDADATGFYGVGHSRSKNMGHGLKSAKLQAEFSLAKVSQQELSGSERLFERGDSEGNVSTQTTFLIDKIIDAVPVVGYEVVEQKMIPLNGVYESFVLLKLPYDEFNKVLQDQKKDSVDKTVQQAFDDLERRLSNRRAEKEKATEATHRRELETIEQRKRALERADNDTGDEKVSSDNP